MKCRILNRLPRNLVKFTYAILATITICENCFSAEFRTLIKPSQGEHVLFQVPADSIVEIVGGSGVIYGGDLGSYTDLGVDLFPLGILKKEDYLAGFQEYSAYFGSDEFITLKIMTTEEAGLGGIIVAFPGQETLIEPPQGYGIMLLSAPMTGGRSFKQKLQAIALDEEGETLATNNISVETGDILAGFDRYRLGSVDGWPFTIAKIVPLNSQGMTLTIEHSADGQTWETLSSKRVEATQAKQFFRARIESVSN